MPATAITGGADAGAKPGNALCSTDRKETSLEYGKPFNPWRLFRGALVPEAILKGAVSRGAALLYGVLGRYAGENGLAWPKAARLAGDLGVPVSPGREPRSVRRWTAELVSKGLIRTTRRGTGHRSLQYEFLWSPLLDRGQLPLALTNAKLGNSGRPRNQVVENVCKSCAIQVGISGITSAPRPELASQDRPELASQEAAVLMSERESVEESHLVVEALADPVRETEPSRDARPAEVPRPAPAKILPFPGGLERPTAISRPLPAQLDPGDHDALRRVRGEFSQLIRNLAEAKDLNRGHKIGSDRVEPPENRPDV